MHPNCQSLNLRKYIVHPFHGLEIHQTTWNFKVKSLQNYLFIRQHPTIVDYSSFGTLWPPQKLFARRSFLPKVRIAASCNLHCCFQQGKNPGYLVYILFIHGDCTTQLQKVSICFYYISHYEDPIMNQPVSHGML